MSKFRFVFSIFTLIICLGFFPISVYLPRIADYYFFFMLAVFYYNYTLKKKDRIKLHKISSIYFNDCNPRLYLSEIEKYNKKIIRSKKGKILHQISKSLIYLDLGDLSACHEILLSLVNQEETFTIVIKFWYYKAWIYYYDEIDQPGRMKILLQELEKLAQTAPAKYQKQLKLNFRQVQARYYVKVGIYLDTAEAIYSEIFKGRYPRLTVVLNLYYLGVIAYKQARYDLAVERLNSVVKNGNQLYVVEKAKQLIEEIKIKTES